MRYFLINKRTSGDGKYIETEYTFAGNTKVLAPNSEVEVPRDEAEVALSRYQTVGLGFAERP